MKFKAEVYIQAKLCQLASDDFISAEGLLSGTVKTLEQTKRHPKGIMIQTLIMNTQLLALEGMMLISTRYMTTYSTYKTFLESSKETVYGHEKSVLEYALKKTDFYEAIYQNAQKANTNAEHKHNQIPKKSYSIKEDMDETQLLDNLIKLRKYIAQWSLTRNNSESGLLTTLETNLAQIANYISDTK